MAFAAGIAPILQVIGTVAAVGSAVVGTAATISANNYQAQIAKRNAELMEINAQRAVQRSQTEQLAQDQQTRALLGEQLAAQSASGLKLGGKSQMLTRKSARMLGRLDAINVRDQGNVEAFNYRMMAADEMDKIKFLNQSSGFALLSGFLDAAGSGASGLANLKPGTLQSVFGGTKPKTSALGSSLFVSKTGYNTGALKLS
jgi:hypothetical protein